MSVLTDTNLDELKQKAVKLRKDIISMIYEAGSGHPGGSLSALDILVLLYYKVMRVDATSCRYHDRDRLILVRLAEACQLAAGPKLRDDTIVCLRWAAAQDDPELWAGIPMDEAQARLEALLQDAGEA